MADVSKVNVNSTDYNIKDSNAMHKGVDRVTAGQSIIAPIGTASTADGFAVNASGDYSHASGYHTIASSDMQHVIGKYNEEDANDTYAFIVGGGRLDFDRKNIFTIDWNGVARDGTENRLLPFKAVSEAEYAALSQAEKTNGTAYFRYEATGIMREIQDNGSATSLTSGALPTGQTITSYLNSNFVVGKGNYNLAHSICAGYVTASGNYINFFVPLLIDRDVTSITLTASPANPHDISFYCKSANYSFSDIDTSGFSVISRRKNGLRLELKFKTTKPATEYAIVVINNLTLTFA